MADVLFADAGMAGVGPLSVDGREAEKRELVGGIENHESGRADSEVSDFGFRSLGKRVRLMGMSSVGERMCSRFLFGW